MHDDAAHRLLGVELTRGSAVLDGPVVDAIGRVAGRLDLGHERARAECVDESGRHVVEGTGDRGTNTQEGHDAGRAHDFAHVLDGRAGGDVDVGHRARVGIDDVPGLGLEPGLRMLRHVGLVWVDLDREVLARIEQLEEEREPALLRRGHRAQEVFGALGHDGAQLGPGIGPIEHAAAGVVHVGHDRLWQIAELPGLADVHALGKRLAIGGQPGATPRTLDEDRIEAKRRELGHAGPDTGRGRPGFIETLLAVSTLGP